MPNLYLALGDSITAGYGVGLSHSFATLYYNRIQPAGYGLSYLNFGVNGLNTAGLAQMLASRRMRDLLARSEIITLTIGSNDLLKAAEKMTKVQGHYWPGVFSSAFSNLDQAGLSIRAQNRLTRIQIAGLYNPLPAGPYQQYLGEAQALITGFNQGLTSWAAKFNAVLIPVERAFRGKESFLLGPDTFHPNIRGHEVIAGLFTRYQ